MDENSASDRQQTMLGLKEKVILDWVQQLRVHITKASQLPTPILINTLPAFYELLVNIATQGESSRQRSTLASEHGGERARLTHYDTQSVVREFQLFRSVVFLIWAESGVSLSLQEVAAVNHAIDQAVAESISGFVMVEERFREQFFSALAHDMRTPLATASMALEMIRQANDFERVHAMAEIAGRQHELLGQMIKDLLDTVVALAGVDISTQFAPMDMLALTQEVARAAQLTHGRNVIVRGEPVEGRWSRSAIRRALENMLNNAVKYGTAGTDVTIALSQFHGRCIVIVENEGQPIPVDQQENIFQLFRRSEQATQKNAAGWGIGLPYVRSVAEQHGGSVGVASTDAKTTFTFDIPIDPLSVLQAKQQ